MLLAVHKRPVSVGRAVVQQEPRLARRPGDDAVEGLLGASLWHEVVVGKAFVRRDVELSAHGCVVALCGEHFDHRSALGADAGMQVGRRLFLCLREFGSGLEVVVGVVDQAVRVRVQAGHDAGLGCRTDGIAHIGPAKQGAAGSERIHVGCFDIRRAQSAHVRALILGKNEKDIGALLRRD